MSIVSVLFQLTIAASVIAAVIVATVVVPIAVTVKTAAAFPTTTAQLPAAGGVDPLWTLVLIARACAVPIACAPYVTAADPVPVTRSPNIAGAWRRYPFVAWWRRWRTNDNAHTDLSVRLGRDKGGAADRD